MQLEVKTTARSIEGKVEPIASWQPGGARRCVFPSCLFRFVFVDKGY